MRHYHQMHQWGFLTPFKPGEEAFHVGVQDYVTVKKLVAECGEDGKNHLTLIAEDKHGRRVHGNVSIFVPVDEAKYYTIKPLWK